MGAGALARPRHAGRAGPAAALAQARRVRAGPVLPARRPRRARHQAQRAPGIAVVRGLVRGAAPGHRPPAAHRRGQAGGRHRHRRPPVRRGAPVRGGAGPREAGHLDAQAERHHRSADARLHGRGDGLRAAHGGAAHQEADHDPDEAGPRLRGGCRAGDPEPGRHRLQGHLQRRHMDGGAVADGTRQGPAPGRDERGGRRCGPGGRGRHDQRSGQAGVRAPPGRQGRARRAHDEMGDELSARTTHARPDRHAHGRQAGTSRGWRGPGRRCEARGRRARGRRRSDDAGGGRGRRASVGWIRRRRGSA